MTILYQILGITLNIIALKIERNKFLAFLTSVKTESVLTAQQKSVGMRLIISDTDRNQLLQNVQ